MNLGQLLVLGLAEGGASIVNVVSAQDDTPATTKSCDHNHNFSLKKSCDHGYNFCYIRKHKAKPIPNWFVYCRSTYKEFLDSSFNTLLELREITKLLLQFNLKVCFEKLLKVQIKNFLVISVAFLITSMLTHKKFQSC